MLSGIMSFCLAVVSIINQCWLKRFSCRNPLKCCSKKYCVSFMCCSIYRCTTFIIESCHTKEVKELLCFVKYGVSDASIDKVLSTILLCLNPSVFKSKYWYTTTTVYDSIKKWCLRIAYIGSFAFFCAFLAFLYYWIYSLLGLLGLITATTDMYIFIGICVAIGISVIVLGLLISTVCCISVKPAAKKTAVLRFAKPKNIEMKQEVTCENMTKKDPAKSHKLVHFLQLSREQIPGKEQYGIRLHVGVQYGQVEGTYHTGLNNNKFTHSCETKVYYNDAGDCVASKCGCGAEHPCDHVLYAVEWHICEYEEQSQNESNFCCWRKKKAKQAEIIKEDKV